MMGAALVRLTAWTRIDGHQSRLGGDCGMGPKPPFIVRLWFGEQYIEKVVSSDSAGTIHAAIDEAERVEDTDA